MKDLASQKQTNINSLTAIMYYSDVLEDYNKQHLAVVTINVSWHEKNLIHISLALKRSNHQFLRIHTWYLWYYCSVAWDIDITSV